jgi:hypothetical protein
MQFLWIYKSTIQSEKRKFIEKWKVVHKTAATEKESIAKLKIKLVKYENYWKVGREKVKR